MTYNGSSWSMPVSIDGIFGTDFFSVSCPSSSFCMALGDSYTGAFVDQALAYNGGSWSTPTNIDSGGGEVLWSVSCPSSSFCAGTDDRGNALTYASSLWSAPTSIDGTNQIFSVSCASSSFCVALEGFGNAMIYNGSSWSEPTSIDNTGYSLESVSCPSESFCMALDSGGYTMTYSFAGPVNTAPPEIGGTPLVGETLTCAPGTWSGDEPFSYTYRWLSNGAAVAGPDSSASYTPSTSDVSRNLECEVTAYNDVGSSAAVSSPVMVSATGRGSGVPGGGNGTPQCSDIASIAPWFAGYENQVITLPSFSSSGLPVGVTAGLKLGSAGICGRALMSLVPGLDLGPPGFDLTATYAAATGQATTRFTYSFAPLGWRPLPGGTGAPMSNPPPVSIEWQNALKFGGAVNPSLSLTYKPGDPVHSSLDLVQVPIAQQSVTLVSLGNPFLQASVGPDLSLGLSLDPKELADEEATDIAEGMTPDEAATAIGEEAASATESAFDAEASALDPGALPTSSFLDTTNVVSHTVASAATSTLPADAADIGIVTAVDGGTIAADGAAGVAVAGAADSAGGDVVIEVIIDLAVLAKNHQVPTSGLVPSSGAVLPRRVVVVSPIHKIALRSLRRADFPRNGVPTLVRNALLLPTNARVRPLAVSSTTLHPGKHLAIVATRLGSGRRHDALLVLSGPNGYRATRLLRVVRGTAGGTMTLPRTLAPGTWTIAVQDISQIHFAGRGRQLVGDALVDFGAFKVGRTAP